MNIPFKKIDLGNSYKRLEPIFETGFIGLGNDVHEFEKKLAEYIGMDYVVATDSCTSALFLSLKYEKAQRVGIPSMTVPLVADAVLEAGAELYFTDKVSWVGSKYRLEGTNIIDSAHELERDMCKDMTSEKVCFSFYPTKNIGSGDGGAIATNDKDFADWARQISTYGRNQGQTYKNSWEYDVDMVGYKRHYTNLQAVVCLEQLERLDETNKRRTHIRDRYNEAFGLDNKSLYLYRIDIENGKRDHFIEYMKGKGIECGVHFKPLHMMKAFSHIPVTNPKDIEREYYRTVSLPFYSLMTHSEVDYIIDSVVKYGLD